MPKISTKQLQIRHKDIQKYYEIVVMYNKDYHFYAAIPLEFKDVVHHLSKEETDELFIDKKHARRYEAAYTPIISSETESDCISKMEKCLLSLVGKSIEQRDIIIVFFNTRGIRYGNHEYNTKHPKISLEFGLTYAVETSIGENKVYSIYSEYEAFGEKRVNRNEISLYNDAATIIPDTKGNREMLEHLYKNLGDLRDKLTEFSSTKEKMIGFIESGMKMLNE